jgi:hypothetical protein
MDAKALDLALLAALSVLCAMLARAGDRDVVWLALFCARCSRDCRRSLWAAALKATRGAHYASHVSPNV